MPYLEGLRTVHAVPERSVAFEDSRSGVQAASSAGIATVGIRTSLAHEDLVVAGAVGTAENSDDPELVRIVAKIMAW
jgi:phosphoglycolate phosphatase